MKPRNLEEALAVIEAQKETIATLRLCLKENAYLRDTVHRAYVRTFLKPMFAKKEVSKPS